MPMQSFRIPQEKIDRATEAAKRLGMSRSKFYELAVDNELMRSAGGTIRKGRTPGLSIGDPQKIAAMVPGVQVGAENLKQPIDRAEAFRRAAAMRAARLKEQG